MALGDVRTDRRDEHGTIILFALGGHRGAGREEVGADEGRGEKINSRRAEQSDTAKEMLLWSEGAGVRDERSGAGSKGEQPTRGGN